MFETTEDFVVHLNNDLLYPQNQSNILHVILAPYAIIIPRKHECFSGVYWNQAVSASVCPSMCLSICVQIFVSVKVLAGVLSHI